MSHFITVPINTSGVITDSFFADEMATACSPEFGTTDVLLYSHGWWTDADSAMCFYNRFSTGFSDQVLKILKSVPADLPNRPAQAFGIGLHWPSVFTENPGSILDKVEVLSYYTMEKRADIVGQNALYTMLRHAIEINQGRQQPLRFHMLGHSFGCKVVSAALQQIALEKDQGEIQQALQINVILLQAAFKNNSFEAGEDYDKIPGTELGARVLVTKSELDTANGTQFPLAQSINVFAPDHDRIALGYAGPTAAARELFGSSQDITINPGFTHSDFNSNSRLICADLTPVHKRNEDQKIYVGDSFGGHHSDINFAELYELIAAFLFK